MTSDDADEARVAMLDRLQLLASDPERAERVRRLCREQLDRRRPRTARAGVMAHVARRVSAPVVVGGFCALYVAALVTTIFRLNGVFR